MTSNLVRANGVDLYYERTGDRGVPLVLIHGGWLDHYNWVPVVPGLSKNWRVLNYDRRGHAMSQKVSGRGSFDEDADDAAALLSQLDLVPANVVGHSTGAIVALRLAAKYPTILRSLAIHEPPLWGMLREDPSAAPLLARLKLFGDVVKTLESGDWGGGTRLFAETGAFGPGGWEALPPRLKETLIANAGNLLDETRDPQGFNVDLNKMSQFEKPTMLTLGGKSPPTFKYVIERLAKTIPGSMVSVFTEAGHMPHVSHTDDFINTLTSFLGSVE